VNAAADIPFEVGISSRMPAAEYRALPGTSITRLKELRRSPLHYRYALAHPKETTALRLGTAAHVAVLEPERFSSQFAIWSRRSGKTGNLCPKNGKWWEAFQGENVGRDIITIDEAEYAMAIQRAVRSDPHAMRYLEQGDPEVTLQWTLRGRPCKGRLDWLTWIEGRPYLVGLKSARDCRHFIFGNAAAKLGYHLQWAYYFDGFEFIKSEHPGVKEIVVENAPPHAVAVYNIPDDIIQQGRDEYMVLHDQLAECERAGEWPGPSLGETDLTLPTWVYEAHDDISELGLEA
jgi:hypothetical protein